ncbi:MAG: hypothetical protein KAI66_24680, partial [Lentisphaeria bacterium]|nr:hypothetical protein [Lentisphaeria bacterium]
MRIPVIEPGVKIGTHVASGASDEYLLFLAQLGIRHVRVHFQPGADGSSHVMHTVDRFGAAGLSIFSVVHLGYQAPEVARGLPGRDKVIGGLVDFIHLMGRLGLHTLEFDFFLYAPLPATGQAVTRGAASREFDLAVARRLPDAFDQCYGEDEMWDS